MSFTSQKRKYNLSPNYTPSHFQPSSQNGAILEPNPNPRKAIIDHVDEEDKNTVVTSDGKRGNTNQTIINESGLYSLILSSKLPQAKSFKRVSVCFFSQ